MKKGRDARHEPDLEMKKGRDARHEPDLEMRKGRDACHEPDLEMRKGRDACHEPDLEMRKGRDACHEPDLAMRKGRDACQETSAATRDELSPDGRCILPQHRTTDSLIYSLFRERAVTRGAAASALNERHRKELLMPLSKRAIAEFMGTF